MFKRATEDLIDRVVQDYFVEYLKEDIAEYTEEALSDKEKRPMGGLL